MSEEQKLVYQFKITLIGVKPPVWREIQVPEDFTFDDFAQAILNSMEWLGGHLYGFEIKYPFSRNYMRLEKEEEDTPITDIFISNQVKAVLTYDYTDFWEHKIELQKILPAVSGRNYPFCVRGRRACPPDDCGGVYAFMQALKIVAKPKNQRTKEEEEELEAKCMENFDPKYFNRGNIDFDNVLDPFEI